MNPKPVEQARTRKLAWRCPRFGEREKQASREADERALANGMSIAELEAKNAFLTPDRTIIYWDPNREF